MVRVLTILLLICSSVALGEEPSCVQFNRNRSYVDDGTCEMVLNFCNTCCTPRCVRICVKDIDGNLSYYYGWIPACDNQDIPVGWHCAEIQFSWTDDGSEPPPPP